MTYNVLDEELEGYLQLIKTDTETGKAVKIDNTAFALYKLDDKGSKTRISMIDPASGNATKKTDVFYTDADGLMKTPEKLPLGRYLIEELQGPEGYYNDPAYSVEFEITSERVWQVVGNATNDMDEYIVEEKYFNHETLGQLTIRKLGNVLTDYKDGQFIYTQDNLAGATYEIHADGDIATPDRQGTYWYKDGDLVATVTTGAAGQVDEVKFAPNRTQATYGNVLLSQGYKVKVFNLKDRDKSDHYNLFAYIKNEDDILVVTKNLVKNLKEDPTAKSTADPIWEEGMTALLEALIGYVFYELEPEERNMNSVMTLLLMLESQGDGPNSVSQLDLLFDDLSINKPNSFAAKQYKLYKMAPGKTAQSINVSLGLRMSAFNIPSIANICADDTIDLRELGSEKKVALFVVTPDTTTAYNFLAAVMFQQCFQILVDIADHRPNKRLPRHLRFLLDEFPNIGMIPDFQILISTIRSRDIACTLIYQSLNQLKSQYKDDWATIYENCDSMIVLGAGGNPENLEFFSKALGKATIEVMNTSENKGSQGSYTKSYQALGRELMTPEEIRTMPRNWCLLMISGVAPFYSRKYNLKDHPNYHLVEAEGGKPFDYDRRAEQSFADFISNVKDVKTVKLCAENNN